MPIDSIEESECEILNIVQELGALEWCKCRPRYAEIRIRGRIERFDQSRSPPSIAFRFENESDEGIAALLSAVETFNGKLHWTMTGRKRREFPGTNWVIRPTRVWDVIEVASEQGLTPDQYLEEHEPHFAPVAYDDLVGLTEHIRQAVRGLLGSSGREV